MRYVLVNLTESMHEIQHTPGIYAIISKSSERFYVGQSRHMGRRRWEHFRMLKHGVHENFHMQDLADNNGIDDFEFVVIECMPLEVLDQAEQIALDMCINDPHCMNVQRSPKQNPNAPELMTFQRKLKYVQMHLKRELTPDELAVFEAHPELKSDKRGDGTIIQQIHRLMGSRYVSPAELRAKSRAFQEREANRIQREAMTKLTKAYAALLPREPKRQRIDLVTNRCPQPFTLAHTDGRTYTGRDVKLAAMELGLVYQSVKNLMYNGRDVLRGWRVVSR